MCLQKMLWLAVIALFAVAQSQTSAPDTCGVDAKIKFLVNLRLVCDSCGYSSIEQYYNADPCITNSYCYCQSSMDFCPCVNSTEYVNGFNAHDTIIPTLSQLNTIYATYAALPPDYETPPNNCTASNRLTWLNTTTCARCEQCGATYYEDFFTQTVYTGCEKMAQLCQCNDAATCVCTNWCDYPHMTPTSSPTTTAPTSTATAVPGTGLTPVQIVEDIVIPILAAAIGIFASVLIYRAVVYRQMHPGQRIPARDLFRPVSSVSNTPAPAPRPTAQPISLNARARFI